MKRYIRSSDIPGGYLRTTRITTPSIKTDDQRNALEALEIAITEKFDQFDKMNEITIHLTSDSFWQGVIEEYEEGYYIKLSATRSGFQAFVQGDSVIRKPRNLSDRVAYYDVEGNRGTVYFMSRARH